MILCIGTTPAVQRVMVFNRVAASSVNRAIEVIESAAGKSVNVAKVLRVLGKEVVATGFLGGDRGAFIRAILERHGALIDFVPVAAQTRMCVTVVDRGTGTHTELVEEAAPADRAAWDALQFKVAAIVKQSKFVTMSGTLAPGGPADFYAQCVRLSNDANVPVLVDAANVAMKLALAAKPTWMKTNRGELAGAVDMTLDSPDSIVRGMRRAIELGAKNVVVTLGGNGAMGSDGKRDWIVRIPKVEVVNTIGSGDAFTAGLVSALVDGAELPEALREAGACGVANALTIMSGEVHLEDVAKLRARIAVETV